MSATAEERTEAPSTPDGAGTEEFDVVVVGARVAGSLTALRFARAGRSVVVLERGGEDSPVLSTHLIQERDRLVELGFGPDLERIGAPNLTDAAVWVDGLDLSGPHEDNPWTSIRRLTLDRILLDRARSEGVEVRVGCRVTGLVRTGGRVTGVTYRVSGRPGEVVLRCGLVVGADGRSSTIAREVDAPTYNTEHVARPTIWCYMTGIPSIPSVFHQRDGDEVLMAYPSDHGRTLLGMLPSDTSYIPEYKPNGAIEAALLDRGRPFAGHEWSELLADARRDSETWAVGSYTCYYRRPAGPGWALVGDAGHVRDAILGQGISDAVRQADQLVDHVAPAWDAAQRAGEPIGPALDAALEEFWRARDRLTIDMHWLSWDVGRSGPFGPLHRALFVRLAHSERRRRDFLAVLSRRMPSSRVLSPLHAAAAALTAIRHPEYGLTPGPLLRDLRVEGLLFARRWLNHRRGARAAGLPPRRLRSRIRRAERGPRRSPVPAR